MKKILSTHFLLKLLFVALLFAFFVWQFAIPSFRKFLYSGVTIDESWVRRQPEDSPSVTFCALNNDIMGWKITKFNDEEDWFTSVISILCKNATTVADAEKCIEKDTFNLTETIKTSNNSFRKAVETENDLWMEDISELYLGRVFRTHIFLAFKLHYFTHF